MEQRIFLCIPVPVFSGKELQAVLVNITTGVYILENTLPPGRGKYQPMSVGGNNMKSGREKEGKCKRKRKKRDRKGKKGERKREKGKKKGNINAK